MATAGLEVREAGRALRVQTEAPHLVSMGSGRLSTAVTLHPLPEEISSFAPLFAYHRQSGTSDTFYTTIKLYQTKELVRVRITD
ncbi:hypothetical protein K0M31_000269 [Melipona bicolor]|uniref:Uncharacterized protein n=1 Tax=Melipona bicolor TaxID=60889 RepID=A0AA40GDY4_9HYME|nr:hypothetical protein K0M31_000269 [Melipona bicolor]